MSLSLLIQIIRNVIRGRQSVTWFFLLFCFLLTKTWTLLKVKIHVWECKIRLFSKKIHNLNLALKTQSVLKIKGPMGVPENCKTVSHFTQFVPCTLDQGLYRLDRLCETTGTSKIKSFILNKFEIGVICQQKSI